MTCELSVIIPTCGRCEKLRTLIEGVAATASDHDAFEVIVTVDGRNEAPLAVASMLPDSIRFVGLTKDHAGPAAARNFAIRHARGSWLLFYDDDARVDARTIPGHLEHIRENPDAATAYLGRVDWPDELIDSPWRVLLAESSMLFFWDRMCTGDAYGFRHFWTSNLSVPRQLVTEVGGFSERFPTAMHEDIELGWRLENAFGLRVRVDTAISSLHDHALDPVDYFRREHGSGRSAAAAREINAEFHDGVWPWLDDPAAMMSHLEQLFLAPARATLDMLNAWAEPSPRRPTADEIRAAYLAHLPLKRMMFLQGYLGQGFEDLWAQLDD